MAPTCSCESPAAAARGGRRSAGAGAAAGRPQTATPAAITHQGVGRVSVWVNSQVNKTPPATQQADSSNLVGACATYRLRNRTGVVPWPCPCMTVGPVVTVLGFKGQAAGTPLREMVDGNMDSIAMGVWPRGHTAKTALTGACRHQHKHRMLLLQSTICCMTVSLHHNSLTPPQQLTTSCPCRAPLAPVAAGCRTDMQRTKWLCILKMPCCAQA